MPPWATHPACLPRLPAAGRCPPSARSAPRTPPAGTTTATRQAPPQQQQPQQQARAAPLPPPPPSSPSPAALAAAAATARAAGVQQRRHQPRCRSLRRARRSSAGTGASPATERCGACLPACLPAAGGGRGGGGQGQAVRCVAAADAFAAPSQATYAHRCQACPDMRPSPACLLIMSTHHTAHPPAGDPPHRVPHPAGGGDRRTSEARLWCAPATGPLAGCLLAARCCPSLHMLLP